MTPAALPFSLETSGVLEARPRVVLEDGAVFAPAGRDWAEPDFPPVLAIAWLAEPPTVTLDDVVAEELARCLDEEDSVLIDYQPVSVSGVEAIRTLVVHRGADGRPPTVSEQWRLVAERRRWTVSTLTTLADQPAFGPPLARVAATLRPSPGTAL